MYILGLTNGTSVDGLDVEGTINGETASGTGQYLIGDSDNENTAGMKLLITLTENQLVEGPEDTVCFNKGVAAIISEKIASYTDSDGVIASRKDGLQLQIDSIADQIENINEQLEIKRASLYQQFTAMEKALSQLQSQQSYLSQTISSLDSNWSLMKGNH